MSKFSNTVKQDTPRLVVEFNCSPSGKEQFKWGIVGAIPVLSLIGYVIKIQSELYFRSPDECDQTALVVVWDEKIKRFSYFVNSTIPIDSLVGMLETVKAMLVASQMQDHQTKDGVNLFDANGQQLRRW